MASQLWALLVGINYEGTAIRQLSGCVNDVKAMKRFLIEQMGVPDKQIKMLTEKEAKRATIIKTFKEFLIENQDIPKGAQILFHFSGHGSQMLSRSKSEPDGRDETIVPYDSRTSNVYDIPDKTLAGLLDKLAKQKGNNITVVLDCCHSGSGTRALDDAILQTRRIDPSLVRLPDGIDEEWYAATTNSNRSLGPSGWESSNSQHVLIAGCRAHEESREHRPPSGDRTIYGALTYFMLDWLRTKSASTTYGDLHEAVATRVNAIYRDQMPQCEGDRNRQVFGGARVARDPFAKVTAVNGNEVTIDCGIVQGM
ncbi:MAG: caspase family protein, partial [Anaerolineae bacterium]|nr:caspase family protein [Anaerolineae bacterium]